MARLLSAQILSTLHLESHWQMFTRVFNDQTKFFYFRPSRPGSKGAENLFLMTAFRRARESLNGLWRKRFEYKKKIEPMDQIGVSSLFRAPKKYTTNSFQVVGLHNAIA